MTAEFCKKLVIKNELGLHARAAATFVKTVSMYNCEVIVKKSGIEASGKSITSLIMLAAGKGAEIEIKATGYDAEKCIQTIKELVDNYFGEEK